MSGGTREGWSVTCVTLIVTEICSWGVAGRNCVPILSGMKKTKSSQAARSKSVSAAKSKTKATPKTRATKARPTPKAKAAKAKSTPKAKSIAKAKSIPKARSKPVARTFAAGAGTGLLPTEAPSLAAAFARFLPAAQKLPVERVVPCRHDVNLIFANVRAGVAAVMPHLARLKGELPALQVGQFTELEFMAGALLHATAQVATGLVTLSRQELDQKLGRLHELRAPMLLCAEVLAMLGLLPRQRVEQIRSGKGAFDAAQDGVALADLYTEYAAALHQKHPFTREQLTEIAGLGHELLQAIRPDGARATASPAAAAATEARDRLYSLLLMRYTDLRRAGFYLYGEEVDDKVPLLGSRKGRSAAALEEPADPPPPAAPAPLPAAPVAAG